jgi:hypothetical protein
MTTVALVFAAIAALVFIAVGIGALCLQARIRRLVDQMQKTLESEARTALRAWADAARGVQHSASELDRNLGALARTLDRLDRLTQSLEPDNLARALFHPALAKLLAWLGGFRKGLASAPAGAEDRDAAPPRDPDPDGSST